MTVRNNIISVTPLYGFGIAMASIAGLCIVNHWSVWIWGLIIMTVSIYFITGHFLIKNMTVHYRISNFLFYLIILNDLVLENVSIFVNK